MNEINRKFRKSRGFGFVETLNGYVFTPEANAHTFRIQCVVQEDNLETVVPFETGSVVSARFLKSDHVTELVEGSLDENGAAVVTLPAECYAVPGRFLLTILVAYNSISVCVYAATGTVIGAESGTVNLSQNASREIDEKIAELNAAAAQVSSAISAGSAKITEINQAAAAARASIPQDYTALSDSVGDLKSAVDTVTGNSIIKFTEKFGYNTGENATLAGQVDNDTNSIKISCSAGDVFTISGEGWASLALWAFYGAIGSDNKYPRLAYSGLNASANMVVLTAPAGAALLVVNVKRSPSVYAGFLCKGVFLQNRLAELESPVTYERTAFFARNHSDNLFDANNIITGRLDSSGAVDSTATTYFTTDYINLNGLNAAYVVPVMGNATNIGASGCAFYDKNKAVISARDSPFTTARTIPDGAVYVRISYAYSGIADFAIFANSTGLGSAQKIYYDNWQIGYKNVNLQGWYNGKKCIALGDSITANGNVNTSGTHSGWRRFVANEMQLADTVYNCGIGGSRVSGTADDAMWQDARIEAIPTDADVVLFNGGMNDWSENVQLGDEDSSDTTTFYGALNTIAEKLIAHVPNAIIFWMTTTYGEYTSDKNSIGLTTYDYGRAIKKVAEKNGFPVIDLHALCGWNKYNVSTFVNTETLNDETIHIHPNESGGKRITTAICSVLRQYQLYT